MKILHTSDWHLGKKLGRFSRLDEQTDVLNEICDIADEEDVSAILISGDIYDTYNPPAVAEDLFYNTVDRLSKNGTRAVLVIAGNHDSPDRISAPRALTEKLGVVMCGYPGTTVKPFKTTGGVELIRADEGFVELTLPDTKSPLRVLLTPYANEHRLRDFLGETDKEAELRALLQTKWQGLADKYCDIFGINILMAHAFVYKRGEARPEEPEDERPILYIGGAQEIYTDNMPSVQYVALGHLHRYINVATEPFPVVYSGTPLCYGLGEAGQKKYVSIVDAEPGNPAKVKRRELTSGKPILRKTFDDIDNALLWLKENPDTWVEITMRTENFLDSKEIKKLSNAHSGIITIIPEVTRQSGDSDGEAARIDFSRSMLDLFKDYYRNKNNTEPSDEILELLREVMGEEE